MQNILVSREVVAKVFAYRFVTQSLLQEIECFAGGIPFFVKAIFDRILAKHPPGLVCGGSWGPFSSMDQATLRMN